MLTLFSSIYFEVNPFSSFPCFHYCFLLSQLLFTFSISLFFFFSSVYLSRIFSSFTINHSFHLHVSIANFSAHPLSIFSCLFIYLSLALIHTCTALRKPFIFLPSLSTFFLLFLSFHILNAIIFTSALPVTILSSF